MLIETLVTYFFMFTRPIPQTHVDLTPLFPTVFNQGKTNSCTAQAITSVAMFHERDALISRLDLYYQSRDDPAIDDGASIQNTMNILEYGTVCNEYLWPFSARNIMSQPPVKCVQKRQHHATLQPFQIPSNSVSIAYAVRMKRPVIVGTILTETFMDSDVRVPSVSEPVIAKHAMVVVGVTEQNKYFILHNLWGTKWKTNGSIIGPRLFIDRFIISSWILQRF